jgi:hypothetical protein
MLAITLLFTNGGGSTYGRCWCEKTVNGLKSQRHLKTRFCAKVGTPVSDHERLGALLNAVNAQRDERVGDSGGLRW